MRELAAQEHDVFLAAVVQVRNVYLYGGKAVIEVLAEFPFLYGFEKVHVGGGHHADVGLLYYG